MNTETTMTGGCMCGAVRYETTGESFGVSHCHCHSCRKHNGAAVVTLVGFKADQVTFSGDERKVYESSPGVGRAFCSNCGTPLTWEGHGGAMSNHVIPSNFTSAPSTIRMFWCQPCMRFIPSELHGSTSPTTCRVKKDSPEARPFVTDRARMVCLRGEHGGQRAELRSVRKGKRFSGELAQERFFFLDLRQ